MYQVLPGPEAHELCVYFGRLRGGKLGGFLAGLGFMLPGFLLMLGLSVALRRGRPGGRARRALLRARPRRSGRWSRGRWCGSAAPSSPTSRSPLIAVAAFVLTLFASASFVLVLLGAGIAYELWTNASRWRGPRGSFALPPLVAVALALGAIDAAR